MADKRSIEELVLVVHGVGDPDPGETLSLFARSIADHKNPLTEHQEVLWLEEEGDEYRMVETFETHVRQLSIDDGQCTGNVSFAEVFWGDLSRVKKGTLGAIAGLIQIVFGLRFLAFVGADQRGIPAKLLQLLGIVLSRVIHGPLLAVNGILLCLALSAFVSEQFWSNSSSSHFWSDLLATACVGVCLLISIAGTYQCKKNKVIVRFLTWLSIAAAFLSGMVIVRMFNIFPDINGSDQGIQWYCNTFIVLLGSLWFCLVLTLSSMIICWSIAMLDRRNHRIGLLAALLLPAISAGVWGLLLPFVWTVFLEVHGKLPAGNQIEEFNLIFQEAIPLMGVQIIMGIMIGCIMAVVLMAYTRWRSCKTVDDYIAGARPPRLIVNGFVQTTVLWAMLMGIGLMMTMAYFEIRHQPYQSHVLGRFLEDANKYAFLPLVNLSLILLMSFKFLRPALDIVGDIITHFHFRRELVRDVVEDNSFDIHEVSFQEGELYFSKRDKIQRRMKTILEHFKRNVTNKPKLSIVSHSQGTMIAVEVLNDSEMDWLDDTFCEVNLVTMGSPLTHVYQHYFAHFYPPLNELFWSNLRARLNRWVNIFRIDDFVGTEIHFDSLSESELEFDNHPVKCKGHNYYWCDRDVLDVIRAYNICQALHPDCAHPNPGEGTESSMAPSDSETLDFRRSA